MTNGLQEDQEYDHKQKKTGNQIIVPLVVMTVLYIIYCSTAYLSLKLNQLYIIEYYTSVGNAVLVHCSMINHMCRCLQTVTE